MENILQRLLRETGLESLHLLFSALLSIIGKIFQRLRRRTENESQHPLCRGHIEVVEEPVELAARAFICVINILNPLLQIYIPPRVQKFYISLVRTDNIDNQCYPNILKSHNGFTLRYVNINGNSKLVNNYRPVWNSYLDYKVTGAVDLTKLFMARETKYNDFSQCDLSELLEIIANMDVFPSNVRTKIKIIKQNVRNPIMHYKSIEWNIEKYEDSLDQMIDLIDSMDIEECEKILNIEKLQEKKIRKESLRVVNGIGVTFNFKLECRTTSQAIIHGFGDQQRQALNHLVWHRDSRLFGIVGIRDGSIILDLTADMTIYDSIESFKLAVHELLHRIVQASGVNSGDEIGLEVEFLLPETLTTEQQTVVEKSFPGALSGKTAIANCSSPQRTLPEELNPSCQGRVERMKEPDEFITTIFICLNTIITPLLKEYIPQVVQDFYNSLVDMHRINTQCYPDVLKEYRGHQYRYGYINGNHLINSRMQAFAPNLDYKVAGAVDLTKLIIWTNRYNQFSDCDLSELCNIITNINSFPPEVVRRIGKVRKVRNSVAHNNTDEWDRPKFITSLNEMTDLIMALDIDSDKQRLCVDKIEKIKKGSNCLRLVDGIPVKFTFTIKTQGSAHEATIHGFSDQQESQTLTKLETEANFNYDNSPFAIKANKKQSIKLDLRADMCIYKSTDSFKLAVYELLQRVITASGVTENDHVGLDFEFLLPKNTTKEQLIVVVESFPGALDRQLEKAILNFKKVNQSGEKWKKVREKTILELEMIERKLNEAAIDLENFRRRRNLVAGASFIGGLLAAPFTGGASLAALGLAFGTVTFVVSLVFEKHLTGEVMKNVQVAIDIDKETTKMLRERAQHYANVDDDLSKRLLKHFPGFILAVLVGSFSEFLKGFIDSTADSVRRTKYEVMDLRRYLKEELRTVEEMLQESMLEVPVEAKRHH